MRRLHKITAVVFLVGVLFTGIGAGVTFAELNSLDYAGRIESETADIRSKQLEYKLSDEEKDNRILIDSYGRYSSIKYVEASEEFPDNMIVFEIKCDASAMEPELYVDRDIDDRETYISFRRVLNDNYDEFLEFMQIKDKILEGIKHKKVYSYDGAKVKSVEIKVSENLRDRIIY